MPPFHGPAAPAPESAADMLRMLCETHHVPLRAVLAAKLEVHDSESPAAFRHMRAFEQLVPELVAPLGLVDRMWLYASAVAVAKALIYFQEGATPEQVCLDVTVGTMEAPQLLRDIMAAAYEAVRALPVHGEAHGVPTIAPNDKMDLCARTLQWCYTEEAHIIDAYPESGLGTLSELIASNNLGPGLSGDTCIEALKPDDPMYSGEGELYAAAVVEAGQPLHELARTGAVLAPLFADLHSVGCGLDYLIARE